MRSCSLFMETISLAGIRTVPTLDILPRTGPFPRPQKSPSALKATFLTSYAFCVTQLICLTFNHINVIRSLGYIGREAYGDPAGGCRPKRCLVSNTASLRAGKIIAKTYTVACIIMSDVVVCTEKPSRRWFRRLHRCRPVLEFVCGDTIQYDTIRYEMLF